MVRGSHQLAGADVGGCVGEVGWGEGIRPAWQYGPLSSREHRLNPASKRSVA